MLDDAAHQIFADQGIETKTGPFKGKNGEQLFVGVPNHVDKLSDDFLHQLGLAYRDIFAHGQPVDTSWGEYVQCHDCGATYSVEDALGLDEYQSLATIESTGAPDLPACQQCGSETVIFYNPEDLVRRFRNEFRQETTAAFMYDDAGNVLGFLWAWIDELRNVWESTFAKFYVDSSLTYDDFVRQVTQNTNGAVTSNTPVLYYAESGMTLPARSLNGYLDMVRGTLDGLAGTTYSAAEISQLPVIATVTPQINAYKILRGAEFQTVCRAPDHDLIVLKDDFPVFQEKFSLPPREFINRFRGGMRQAIKESQAYSQAA